MSLGGEETSMSSYSVSLQSVLTGDNCPALFGANPIDGLVAVEVNGQQAITWKRSEQGVERSQEDFSPFFWVSEASLVDGFVPAGEEPPYTVEPLSGQGIYRFLVKTTSTELCLKLSRFAADKAHISLNHPDSPVLLINDFASQYLMSQGCTFYGGMGFKDVARLQIALVPECGPGMPLHESTDSPLQAAAFAWADGSIKTLEIGQFANEKALLKALIEAINDYDPDVIEGYELFNDILPYLMKRAQANRLPLAISRPLDEETLKRTAPVVRASSLQIAEKKFEYNRAELFGRDLVDLWVLACLYDVSSREMESFAAVDVAVQLGILDEEQAQRLNKRLQASELASSSSPAPAASGMDDLFAEDPVFHPADSALLLAEDLAALMHKISDVLAYPYFMQTRIFPYTCQNVVLRGNATRINSLFLREYLRQGEAVSAKPVTRSFVGGLTEQEHVGLAHQVVHCDVQSLYPSIMVSFGIGPRKDSLNIFLSMLTQLRDFRLKAKQLKKDAQNQANPNQEEVLFYDALQSTFKILINSFYGYLGFAQGNFADYEAAAQITAKGRELLTFMMDRLREEGSTIIEVDTDGIYFVPPVDFRSPEHSQILIDNLNEQLPKGINVELDGFFKAMYCHKKKNYALLDYDDKVTLRGSALRSRSLEPFLRETLAKMLTLTLHGKQARIPVLLEEVAQAVQNHAIGVDKLAKTENLVDSLATYSKKIAEGARNRAAVYELALASGRPYKAGSSLSYYVTGNKATVRAWESARLLSDYNPAQPDENIKYYLAKLRDLNKKFPLADALEI